MAETNVVRELPKTGTYDDYVVLNPRDGLGMPLDECSPRELSPYGKDLVAAYLNRCGLKVIDRDWLVKGDAKVDLVALDGDCVVLVEVRTRLFGSTQAARSHDVDVDSRRRRRLQYEMLMWLAKHASFQEARYDVVSVRVENAHRSHVRHLVGVCTHHAR